MTRPRLTLVCTTLLLTCAGAISTGCDSAPADAPATQHEPAAPVAARAPTPAPATSPATTSATSASPTASPTTLVDEQPVLASGTSVAAPVARPQPGPAPAAHEPDDLRSPSLLPAGTPEAHALAFAQVPVRKSDKAPVGGVGATGVHLDELAVGKGWAASRCEDLGSDFTVGVDERVSVCFRVVHPAEVETVTLEWARAGKVRQTIDLDIKATHAYLTRAWLPVSGGRVGDWTATIKSADGSVLGEIGFAIGR